GLVMALAPPAAPAAGAPRTAPPSDAGLPAHRPGGATLPARPVDPPGASCETVAAGGLLAGRPVTGMRAAAGCVAGWRAAMRGAGALPPAIAAVAAAPPMPELVSGSDPTLPSSACGAVNAGAESMLPLELAWYTRIAWRARSASCAARCCVSSSEVTPGNQSIFSATHSPGSLKKPTDFGAGGTGGTLFFAVTQKSACSCARCAALVAVWV